MTLKEELEILRGESIKVFTGNSTDVPCIETSDPEKLCRHPVVSVQMITYNHEPYIRQAIEGVMMQKTDFEFELIIGEDCSQDKTREICFEYQKKYPDKIRVLWWHENVSKLGGNGRRCAARRRGEFVAFCEGDDYWIDPFKLQKQVDVFRTNAQVGICFTGAKVVDVQGHELKHWNSDNAYSPGPMSGKLMMRYLMFGKYPENLQAGDESHLITASVMLRSSTPRQAALKYSIYKWSLLLGDTRAWLGCASLSDAYFLSDVTVAYRHTPTGACSRWGEKLMVDGSIVRIYFAVEALGLKTSDLPTAFVDHIILRMFRLFSERTTREYFAYRMRCRKAPHLRLMLFSWRYFVVDFLIAFRLTLPRFRAYLIRWLSFTRRKTKFSNDFLELCKY